jgi:hypothetical protein
MWLYQPIPSIQDEEVSGPQTYQIEVSLFGSASIENDNTRILFNSIVMVPNSAFVINTAGLLISSQSILAGESYIYTNLTLLVVGAADENIFRSCFGSFIVSVNNQLFSMR